MGTERGELRSINPIRPEESLLLQVIGIQARSFLQHSRWSFLFCWWIMPKLIYFFMPENIQSMNMEGALISSQALPSAPGTARVCAESMVVIPRLTRELAISFFQSCICTSNTHSVLT